MLQVSLRCGVPLLLLAEGGLSVPAPGCIVPLKARAWIDLTDGTIAEKPSPAVTSRSTRNNIIRLSSSSRRDRGSQLPVRLAAT